LGIPNTTNGQKGSGAQKDKGVEDLCRGVWGGVKKGGVLAVQDERKNFWGGEGEAKAKKTKKKERNLKGLLHQETSGPAQKKGIKERLMGSPCQRLKRRTHRRKASQKRKN